MTIGGNLATSVKLSNETVESARQQAQIFQRTLGGQVDYWAKIGRLAELYPSLTFDCLQKLMRENRLQPLTASQPIKKQFNAISLKTYGYRFDREDANAR
ncbi:ParD-like antitoxin of type II toxin-antitoxin system [Thiothrix eikelboomii]|uniref:ParD-like antitoxin of type II toxin-antitoxin system n=1 Tax=Thiothrix eikelboomii TaxID=92487 RepID=A0A1T4VUX9_9GAMM|nr:ParD-like antitoxin of type II toxin-antitoxin system [Thiothrix eikelboomii]